MADEETTNEEEVVEEEVVTTPEEEEVVDKDSRIKELEEELEKERGKEKNFKSLKDQEKGKRLKISERVELVEQQLAKEREDRQNLQNSIMVDAKSTALDQLAGDDKDLRTKLEERVKESEIYQGAPKDSKELTERYEKAYGYLEGSQKRVNPLHSYSPVTGSQNDIGRKGKRFTDSAEGQKLMEDKFPQIVALEKKKK